MCIIRRDITEIEQFFINKMQLKVARPLRLIPTVTEIFVAIFYWLKWSAEGSWVIRSHPWPIVSSVGALLSHSAVTIRCWKGTWRMSELVHWWWLPAWYHGAAGRSWTDVDLCGRQLSRWCAVVRRWPAVTCWWRRLLRSHRLLHPRQVRDRKTNTGNVNYLTSARVNCAKRVMLCLNVDSQDYWK